MSDRKGLKVYQYGQQLVLAKHNIDAALILSAEYGQKFKPADLKRYRGPFVVNYYGGDHKDAQEVTEAYFVSCVATYAGGIVHDGS